MSVALLLEGALVALVQEVGLQRLSIGKHIGTRWGGKGSSYTVFKV